MYIKNYFIQNHFHQKSFFFQILLPHKLSTEFFNLSFDIPHTSTYVHIHVHKCIFAMYAHTRTHLHRYVWPHIDTLTYLCWLTIVEGNPKAPFSIATLSRCRRGHYSFPWVAPLTLDTHLIILSIKQGGIKYHSLNLLYDSIRDWTLVSQTIGKHCPHAYIHQHRYTNTYIDIHTYTDS